jgi:hypothetical protein
MQNSKSPFSFELGIPEHGWLSVNILTNELNLSFESSDVPTNPIEQLISSLILLSNGVAEPPTVSWHLEPSYYHFDFRETNDLITLEISTSEQATSKYELTGTFTEIIYPIYRELRKFGSAEHQEPHWPNISRTRYEELKKAVKNRS